MTIDRAISALREEYKRACKNPVVYDPVSWALHQVWMRSDWEFEMLYGQEMEEGQEPQEAGGGLFDPDNC